MNNEFIRKISTLSLVDWTIVISRFTILPIRISNNYRFRIVYQGLWLGIHVLLCIDFLYDFVSSLRHVLSRTRHLVNTNIGTIHFSVAAGSLWNMLPFSVKSVENIAKFRCHLKKYLYNLVYSPQLLDISTHMLTTGISIRYEIDQHVCLRAPLGLVFNAQQKFSYLTRLTHSAKQESPRLY